MQIIPIWRLRYAATLLFLVIFGGLCLFAPAPSHSLNLFATHEVTAQFATSDGKPMADAEVRVFAPGNSNKVITAGRTDAAGKFVFEADRDGMWSAEARNAKEVARVTIRVGGEAQLQSDLSPFLIIGALAVLLVLAIWYRLVRARSRPGP